MTGAEFQKILNELPKKVISRKEYADLCKQIWNYNNPKKIVKKEAEQIKDEFQLDFMISGNEGLFYKDYVIEGIQIRFIIPYKHGMIDSYYRVFNGLSDNSFPSLTYREIVQLERDTKDDPTFSFPIIGNIEDFKTVLISILFINDVMINNLKTEIE